MTTFAYSYVTLSQQLGDMSLQIYPTHFTDLIYNHTCLLGSCYSKCCMYTIQKRNRLLDIYVPVTTRSGKMSKIIGHYKPRSKVSPNLCCSVQMMVRAVTFTRPSTTAMWEKPTTRLINTDIPQLRMRVQPRNPTTPITLEVCMAKHLISK